MTVARRSRLYCLCPAECHELRGRSPLRQSRGPRFLGLRTEEARAQGRRRKSRSKLGASGSACVTALCSEKTRQTALRACLLKLCDREVVSPSLTVLLRPASLLTLLKHLEI